MQHAGGPTDPSHDRDLRRGVLHTRVSRGLAWAMTGLFLAGAAAVPIAQAALEKARGEDSALLEVFRRAPTRANLKQYEHDLEDACYARDWVRPRAQEALSRWGGFGNVKGVIAREGWLYYEPGVMAVAGPGFLDADVHRSRRKQAQEDGDEVHPDPRPAVLALNRALAALGIRLVLFPVPDKATIEPAQLHGRGGRVVPAEGNRDLPRFLAEMRAAGVAVFDPTPASVDAASPRRFLAQDTHWTPAWMDEVARALAAFVAREAQLPRVPRPEWRTVSTTVTRVGDIVDMLKLPAEQTLFAPRTLTIAQVQDAAGTPWQPSAQADVLLLGDSFTNIYSEPAMGWGEAAGLAPHLALALGRPVDVIAQNDSGAYATRKLLSEALRAGEDRLAGKRAVIWELASRELAVGDFRPYSYEFGKAP